MQLEQYHTVSDKRDRCWAEISLANLANNIANIRAAIAPQVKIMGVIKGDAYGHGAVMTARTMIDCGVEYLAVATVDEALELRCNDIKTPILVLGYTDVSRAMDIVANDLTQTVYELTLPEAMSLAAIKLNKTAKIHLKIETGMERIGIPADEHLSEFAKKLYALPNVDVEGIFTHFATADEAKSDFVKLQFERFKKATEVLATAGYYPRYRHCCNSAAILRYPEYHLDMVRAGGLVYGFVPDFCHVQPGQYKPLMSLYAKVVLIKKVAKGTSIGYNRRFTASRDMWVATISVGYGDGIARALSEKLQVLLAGHRVRQVGNICMDLCMIDITDIVDQVKLGDQVTVFGAAATNSMTADELAALQGTINYEITININKRVPRFYDSIC